MLSGEDHEDLPAYNECDYKIQRQCHDACRAEDKNTAAFFAPCPFDESQH